MKPPRLILRFALLTALGFALAGGAILWFLREDAVERAQREAAARARSLAYTTLRDALVRADLERPVTTTRREELDDILLARVLVEGAGILRVSLVNPNGMVTYSTEQAQIGARAFRGDRLGEALRGDTVFQVTRLDDGAKTLASYVPIRLSGGVRPSGVLQVYEDYSPVAREVGSAVKEVATVLAVALIVLYAALFPVLRRVTRGLGAHAQAEADRRVLAEQNERLRELDRLKDDFIASVSHELRTPLTSIRGYLELMLEDDVKTLTTEQQDFLEVIDRNADRLLQLVGDLLFVAQLDAGQLALTRSEVDLEALVVHAVDAARPLAEQRRIDVAAHGRPVPGVFGDSTRLAQLLDNLVSNAIKFTPEGGRVDIRTDILDGHAVIEVSDTGVGISRADTELIFDRFYRTRDAGSQAIQGSGLGLAIAKAIVEAHDGRIGVESRQGQGTTFRVELPLWREPADEEPAEQAAA
jgi:signal transduction histidine kinase